MNSKRDQATHVVSSESAAGTLKVALGIPRNHLLISEDPLSYGPAPATDDLLVWRLIREKFLQSIYLDWSDFTMDHYSENDLLKIYSLVTRRHRSANFQYQNLQNGHYYSNGVHGALWSIRQIVDWSEADESGEEKLIYKIIVGDNRRDSGVMTKNEFSRWARYEVVRDDENWRRVDDSAAS